MQSLGLLVAIKVQEHPQDYSETRKMIWSSYTIEVSQKCVIEYPELTVILIQKEIKQTYSQWNNICDSVMSEISSKNFNSDFQVRTLHGSFRWMKLKEADEPHYMLDLCHFNISTHLRKQLWVVFFLISRKDTFVTHTRVQ